MEMFVTSDCTRVGGTFIRSEGELWREGGRRTAGGQGVLRRLGVLRRCGAKGGERRREQPYRRPAVIGIGVKVQRVDNCAAYDQQGLPLDTKS